MPGEQERGSQEEQTGDRDPGPRAGHAGQQPPQGGQRRDGGTAGDRPGGQGAGDPVRGGLSEPVGGEHRVEHADAGDQAQLDGDDEQQPSQARADERQPNGPARAKRPRGAHDPVPPVPRDQPAGQPGADDAADAGCGERQAVLPRGEPEAAEHEDGDQRLDRQDQAVDREHIEEHRAQRRVGQDVPPSFGQVAGPQPREGLSQLRSYLSSRPPRRDAGTWTPAWARRSAPPGPSRSHGQGTVHR